MTITFTIILDLLRKYPEIADEFLDLLEPAITVVNNNTVGLSSLVWILGEFGEKIQYTPYILENLIENYAESETNVLINAILLASCKMFFKSPGEMQEILGKVFDFIMNNFNDVDLKDRTLYLYNLMKSNIEEAEYIICGERATVDKFLNVEDELSEKIYTEFNSLSIIYNKPEEKFIRKFVEVDDIKKEQNEDENKYDEENADVKPEEQGEYEDPINIFNAPKYDKSRLSGKALLKEEQYSELINEYDVTLTRDHSPIEEIEVQGFVGYLEEQNIFVKAYEEGDVLNMYLYSLDVSFLILLIFRLKITFIF